MLNIKYPYILLFALFSSSFSNPQWEIHLGSGDYQQIKSWNNVFNKLFYESILLTLTTSVAALYVICQDDEEESITSFADKLSTKIGGLLENIGYIGKLLLDTNKYQFL